jgi:butyrate kinase
VAFLGPVEVLPGEQEMFALAENVLDVLRGKRQVQCYQRIDEIAHV